MDFILKDLDLRVPELSLVFVSWSLCGWNPGLSTGFLANNGCRGLMDNITHSLTGALLAKYIEARPTAPEEKKMYRRTFFWLFVLSANIPDIDVLFGVFNDPLSSIKYHRGITHSLLFAPLFALLPAAAFLIFSKVKNIRLLWIVALLGIVVHSFFDLITPFGTQILSPLSETRYALDWMFIIDPFFTLILLLGLAAGKLFPRKTRIITSMSIAIVSLYVTAAAFNQSIARIKVREAAGKQGIGWTRISALPQPLSIFSWQGLVQTEEGVWQTFFSVFDDGPIQFKEYPHTKNDLMKNTIQDSDLQRYLTFARHPSVRSYRESDHYVVEFRDLMFSVNEELLQSFGFVERSLPFVLSYEYDEEGNLLGKKFDGKEIR